MSDRAIRVLEDRVNAHQPGVVRTALKALAKKFSSTRSGYVVAGEPKVGVTIVENGDDVRFRVTATNEGGKPNVYSWDEYVLSRLTIDDFVVALLDELQVGGETSSELAN